MKSYLTRRASFVLFFIAALSLSISTAYGGTYSDGTGEPNAPYLIATPEDMNAIGANANDWDKHFKLIADINLSGYTGTQFNIIGEYHRSPFTGVFDGNGHSISNFTYTATEVGYVGLFTYVGYGAIIKNLTLIDPNVDGLICERPAGALVAKLEHGTIYNCNIEGGNVYSSHNTGGLIGDQYYGLVSSCHATCDVSSSGLAGGLVGRARYCTILDCYATGDAESTVDGAGMAGGLVAKTVHATISDCYATGAVTGKGATFGETGGLIGFDYQGTVISNCYATGAVTGEESTGGLLGRGNSSTISNCYTAGAISGNSETGGLVGYSGRCSFTKCFWNSTVNPLLDGIGNITDPNVIGKTTAEMQTESTFTSAGWDFDTPIWCIDDGNDYPQLWWELVPDTPTLQSEPGTTLWTSNTIMWDLAARANSYYAECAEDVNFTSTVDNSGWIADTNCTFTDLTLGQTYFYRVKAKTADDFESDWSNAESSTQVTLTEAIETVLDPVSLKNENTQNALQNKIDAALDMIDDGLYAEALEKLENDILRKTNGCADTGEPDKNDWIMTCEQQNQVYPLILETIDYVRSLME